jgi:hypothetical protein
MVFHFPCVSKEIIAHGREKGSGRGNAAEKAIWNQVLRSLPGGLRISGSRAIALLPACAQRPPGLPRISATSAAVAPPFGCATGRLKAVSFQDVSSFLSLLIPRF